MSRASATAAAANALPHGDPGDIGLLTDVGVQDEQVAAQQVDANPVEGRSDFVDPLHGAMEDVVGCQFGHLPKLVRDSVAIEHGPKLQRGREWGNLWEPRTLPVMRSR